MDSLGAAQSRLSFHLRVLKDAGLVTDRREGRWVYYESSGAALADAQRLIGELTPRAATAGARARCCE